MTEHTFEKINEMKLNHLPNDAKLVIQRQRSDVIGKKIQILKSAGLVDTPVRCKYAITDAGKKEIC